MLTALFYISLAYRPTAQKNARLVVSVLPLDEESWDF